MLAIAYIGGVTPKDIWDSIEQITEWANRPVEEMQVEEMQVEEEQVEEKQVEEEQVKEPQTVEIVRTDITHKHYNYNTRTIEEHTHSAGDPHIHEQLKRGEPIDNQAATEQEPAIEVLPTSTGKN